MKGRPPGKLRVSGLVITSEGPSVDRRVGSRVMSMRDERVKGQLGYFGRRVFTGAQLAKKKANFEDMLSRVIWLAMTPKGISARDAYDSVCFSATGDVDLKVAAAATLS